VTALAALAGLTMLLVMPRGTFAQGALYVYCSVQADWCQAIATESSVTAV
jgi:hypothetical protein